MLAASCLPLHRLPTPPLDDDSESHPWFRPAGMPVPECGVQGVQGEDDKKRLKANNIKAINGLLGTRQPTGPDFSEIARPAKSSTAPAVSRYSQLMASKFGSSSGSQDATTLQDSISHPQSYIPLQAILNSAERLNQHDTVLNREFASQSYIQSNHSALPSSREAEQARKFESQQQPQHVQTNPYPTAPSIQPASYLRWEQPAPVNDVLADFRNLVANRLASVYAGSYNADARQQGTAPPPPSFFAPFTDKAPGQQVQQASQATSYTPISYWNPPAQENAAWPVPKTPYEQLLAAKFGRATETAAVPSIEAMTGGEVPPGYQEQMSALHSAHQVRVQSRDQTEMLRQTQQLMGHTATWVSGAANSDNVPQWANSLYGNVNQSSIQDNLSSARVPMTPVVTSAIPSGALPPTPVLGQRPANSDSSNSAKNVYTTAYEAFAKSAASQEAAAQKPASPPLVLQQSQQPQQQPPSTDFARFSHSQYPPTPVTPQSQTHALPHGSLVNNNNPYPTPQYNNMLHPASQPFLAAPTSPASSHQTLPRSPVMAPSSPPALSFHDEGFGGLAPNSMALDDCMQAPMWQLMGSRSPLPTTTSNAVQASGSASGSGDGSYGAGDLGDSGLPLGNFIGGDGYGGEYGNGDGGDHGHDGHDENGLGNGDGDGHNQNGQGAPRKLALACHFCRGRKLKCDGVRPTCAHCVKRGLECSYDSVVRRRGPGKRNKEDKEKGDGNTRKGSRKRSKADDNDGEAHKRLRTEEENDLDLVDPALVDLEPLRLAALAGHDEYIGYHSQGHEHEHEHEHEHGVHHDDDVPVDPALLGAHLH